MDGAKGYSSFDVKNSQSTAYVYDFPFVVITISYSHEFDSICYSYSSFFKYFNLKASQKDTNVPSTFRCYLRILNRAPIYLFVLALSVNAPFTNHTVLFYLQHSLQLPWSSYVPVSRLRHISMYVLLPSSVSDFVSSALVRNLKKMLSSFLFELPSVYLFLNSVANCVEKFVLYISQ